MEEARRRAQVEQYYRQKAAREAEEARRREHYYLRVLRERELEEEEYRRAYDEAIRRNRQKMERKYRKNHQLGRMGLYRYTTSDDDEETFSDHDDDDHEEQDEGSAVVLERPAHKIVQGPDGRLYRIDLADKPTPKPKEKRRAKKQSTVRNNVEPAAGSLDRVEEPIPSPATTSNRVPLAAITPNKLNLAEEKNKTSMATHQTLLSSNGSKKSKKKVTVIVEDVISDSEDEDEFQSVWRNRRPSPGQWIEPVEDFEDMKLNHN